MLKNSKKYIVFAVFIIAVLLIFCFRSINKTELVEVNLITRTGMKFPQNPNNFKLMILEYEGEAYYPVGMAEWKDSRFAKHTLDAYIQKYMVD